MRVEVYIIYYSIVKKKKILRNKREEHPKFGENTQNQIINTDMYVQAKFRISKTYSRKSMPNKIEISEKCKDFINSNYVGIVYLIKIKRQKNLMVNILFMSFFSLDQI